MLLPLLLLAGCSEAAGTRFADAEITLPEDIVELPDGPNVKLVRTACTGCHSADMILYQPPLDAKGWAANVEKMVTLYKAPIAVADRPAIIAYLDGLDTKPRP